MNRKNCAINCYLQIGGKALIYLSRMPLITQVNVAAAASESVRSGR